MDFYYFNFCARFQIWSNTFKNKFFDLRFIPEFTNVQNDFKNFCHHVAIKLFWTSLSIFIIFFIIFLHSNYRRFYSRLFHPQHALATSHPKQAFITSPFASVRKSLTNERSNLFTEKPSIKRPKNLLRIATNFLKHRDETWNSTGGLEIERGSFESFDSP